jgi:hypothetical protein
MKKIHTFKVWGVKFDYKKWILHTAAHEGFGLVIIIIRLGTEVFDFVMLLKCRSSIS